MSMISRDEFALGGESPLVLNHLVTVSVSFAAIKFTHSVKSFRCNKLVSNQGGNTLFEVNHHTDAANA